MTEPFPPGNGWRFCGKCKCFFRMHYFRPEGSSTYKGDCVVFCSRKAAWPGLDEFDDRYKGVEFYRPIFPPD